MSTYYEFVPGASPLFGDYNSQRAVEITRYDGDKLWNAAGGAAPGNRYQTLVRCLSSVDAGHSLTLRNELKVATTTQSRTIESQL